MHACIRSGPGKPNQRKVSSWTFRRGIPEQKFNVNRACFPKEKHQNSQKWAKIHELFVLALYLVWFAGATPECIAFACNVSFPTTPDPHNSGKASWYEWEVYAIQMAMVYTTSNQEEHMLLQSIAIEVGGASLRWMQTYRPKVGVDTLSDTSGQKGPQEPLCSWLESSNMYFNCFS